jgi:small-conductance mechanosensitive channel
MLVLTAAYGIWAARKASKVKTLVVNRFFRRYNGNNKRAKLNVASKALLLNRMLDAVIYLVAGLMFLDANNIDVGVALKSLLTLGGVSSVVVGLVLKEPVSEIFQGLSTLLSNKFTTGDVIKLKDGSAGKVLDHH